MTTKAILDIHDFRIFRKIHPSMDFPVSNLVSLLLCNVFSRTKHILNSQECALPHSLWLSRFHVVFVTEELLCLICTGPIYKQCIKIMQSFLRKFSAPRADRKGITSSSYSSKQFKFKANVIR